LLVLASPHSPLFPYTTLFRSDIDRGGVFAALYGTVALLPDRYRRLVRAFVINKLRGDPALLGDGLGELEARAGVPVLGVLPFVRSEEHTSELQSRFDLVCRLL